MTERQSTPDVLGRLMSGASAEEESNKARKPAVQRAIKQAANKTTMSHTPSPYAVNSAAEELTTLKEKATFNLPVKLLSELEDRWMEIRKLAGSKQISKTLIVEVALEMAFAEFDAAGQESKLYSKLASNNAIRQ